MRLVQIPSAPGLSPICELLRAEDRAEKPFRKARNRELSYDQN